MADLPILPVDQIIYTIRGHRVMLSPDLARLYEVPPKVLIQAVKRNIERFPSDFMFLLTTQEAASLRSQIVTLKPGRGRHQKYRPYAFTEQGVAMLSSAIRSQRAIQANIAIMRSFVRLRQMALTHKDVAFALAEIARKVHGHDETFKIVFDAIRKLMVHPPQPRKRIGFTPPQ
jgi:hypothetical protein